MDPTPAKLLDDYNVYWQKTGLAHKMRTEGRFVRGYKLTPDRERALTRMTTWCATHGLNPRLYVYSLFKTRNFVFPPPFTQLTPGKKTEKKALERYAALSGVEMYQKVIQTDIQLRRIERGAEFDPNRDLSNAAESLKRQYVAEQLTSQCMDTMRAETFGYHPKSLVCVRCPARAECLSRLKALTPFDVLALRQGTITSQQAREQAVMWRGPQHESRH